LTQINALPELQGLQLVKNSEGQLEITVNNVKFTVIPERIRQTNRPVQIIEHGNGKVTVITAQGREIKVQLIE